MSRSSYIYIAILPDKKIWRASTAKYVIVDAIKKHKILNYEVIRVRDADYFRHIINDPSEAKIDITEQIRKEVNEYTDD